ncbi:MAG: hypothetical protein QOH78_242, partial [Verrucomicrobiota bacterium]
MAGVPERAPRESFQRGSDISAYSDQKLVRYRPAT